jgi:hypothetical protein
MPGDHLRTWRVPELIPVRLPGDSVPDIMVTWNDRPHPRLRLGRG